ncbi:MAG: hypothetical protein LC109_14415, partial [Bacteroidia bacterium]|nr:hypothetical protein [Bacteroidia bacterium]
MKKILSIASLFVFCFSVPAQETQWLFSINNVVRSVSPVVCRNIDGNIVLSNSFTNTGSFQFKGTTVTTTNLNTATTTNLMLSSVTPDSSLMWVFSTDVNTNQNIAPIDITTDEVGNIYLLLHYNGGSISFSSNIQLSYPSGYSGRRNALIKFDRNGNPLWAKEYGSTTLDPTDQVTHKMDYSGGRIYIYHTLRGIMEYTGSNQTCSATDSWNYGLAAYDSNGSFLWVKQYGSIVGSATARRDLKATLSSIYFTAYFDKEYIHNSDTLPKGYYLIQLDTAGRLANYIYIKYATRNISSYSGIKFDVDTFSGSVYMGLPFHDSIEILSHKEISKTNFTNPLSFCLLKLNKQMDSLVWCKCQDSLSQGFLSPVAGLLLDNNNLYLGGQLTGDSVYLSNTLFGTGLTAGSKLFIAKADTLGNLLWGFANGNLNVVTSINSMTVDTVGNLLLAGVFVGKVRIFNDSLANNNIAGSFLAKITDYSITRGEVLSGPYCAGDTFLVPYTKMGNYDTANYFIAELSDEKGNFEGGERELGQMKSTQDSTIIGRLPLFQVASSGNYRIRVRSTHPPVQSFYKLDSLRLLIYSRDKADPGPSETLCYGDSFQLHTYGGTAWEWSPAFRMDDSSSRTPWIYLEKDTVFRIVISDSSGCGEPDTAFKQIFIKSNPKIITDRLVNICNNTNITLSAQFKNGDSSAYKWTWYDTEQDFSWQELKSDSFAYFDSLNYIFKSKPVSTNIGLVLEDGCSIVKDTAFVLINLNSPLEVVSDLQDTTVCIGEKIHIRAFANGGDSLNYNFKWYFKDSLIGEKQSLEFTPSDYFILEDLQTSISNSLKVFVFDDCMGIDSFVAQITVRAKLEVSVLDEYQKSANDTSVCSGSELKFFANGTGGVEEDYEFTWLLDDEEISKGDSVEINSKDFKSP